MGMKCVYDQIGGFVSSNEKKKQLILKFLVMM